MHRDEPIRIQKTITVFKEQLKEILAKRLGGIHLRQVQYQLENYSGKKYPTGQQEYPTFSEFLYDCSDFVEVRSKDAVGGKDMFLYMQNSALNAANRSQRSLIQKTERELLKCETVLEPISEVSFSLPRFFRPKSFVPGCVRQRAVVSHDANNCAACNEPSTHAGLVNSEVGRAKSSSVLNSARSAAHSVTQKHRTANPSLEGQLPLAQSQKNLVSKDYSNKISANDIVGDSKHLPEIEFPVGEFLVKLLGCDESSFIYITIDEKELRIKYNLMKQKLRSLTAENLQSIPVDSLQEGETILAYNVYSSTFFRALVLQKNSEDGSVELCDVDTATKLRSVVESTYVLPSEFFSLPPRAVKVALEKHLNYLGTTAVYEVFDHPTISKYYNCEFVHMLKRPTFIVPVVRFLDMSNGLHVGFRSLITPSV